jgi:hypothetical protein
MITWNLESAAGSFFFERFLSPFYLPYVAERTNTSFASGVTILVSRLLLKSTDPYDGDIIFYSRRGRLLKMT